jgi:hypothetical protein
VTYQVKLGMDCKRYFIQDRMDCRSCEISSVMFSAGSLGHSESETRAYTRTIHYSIDIGADSDKLLK